MVSSCARPAWMLCSSCVSSCCSRANSDLARLTSSSCDLRSDSCDWIWVFSEEIYDGQQRDSGSFHQFIPPMVATRSASSSLARQPGHLCRAPPRRPPCKRAS